MCPIYFLPEYRSYTAKCPLYHVSVSEVGESWVSDERLLMTCSYSYVKLLNEPIVRTDEQVFHE